VAVPLKFRHRVGLLVALTATALTIVTTVALILGTRGEQQLAGIETRYVPLIELDRDLKAQFAEIPRALEDAAAAAEDGRLRDADQVYAAMMRRLQTGRHAITANGGDPVALEAELASYYANARDVAAALAAGAAAGQLGTKIDRMRRAQEAVRAKLDSATAPDRGQISAAFAAARASQRDAIWTDIIVGSCALALIGVLSWRFIRDTVHALQAVSVGVERLARGEFSQEISVTTGDELGDLAREANRTALRLREYRERAERDAAELRGAYATVEARNATLVATQQLLEERAEELARASRYKSEFLANMSHELRTPLNSIMILSKILAENQDRGSGGGMTDKQMEFAALIHKSGEELLSLINEVLDLAKIEAGKQELTCERYALADLQDYLRLMFRPIATQRQLGFEVACDDDLPASIRTDPARLAQILKNLIANAFKFTERGGVSVHIRRGRSAELAIAHTIAISVFDTGIGIAADKQAWIFEAFAQAEAGITRKFGGTGLGLTIAKQLAGRLGGDLHVESALGIGSTFSVVLPVGGPPDSEEPTLRQARSASPTAPMPPRPSDDRSNRPTGTPYLVETVNGQEPDPQLDGKTVLIVDDDMRNVYSLSNALSAKRLSVITAADGQEALEELARHPALDAVLMDLMMPRMDGLEAIRQLRAQPRYQKLPVIVLTAQTGDGERERCIAAGASDYVHKPVDISQLISVLRTWLG
jgi:signal transduction histidine kinase